MAIKPQVARKAATPGNITNLRLGKKLVLYGAPVVGKTTCAVSLAEAGWNIVYIDIDGNPEPLIDLSEGAKSRVTYIPLRNNSSNPTRHKALINLSDTGKITWCAEHGLYECPQCSASDQYEWNARETDWSNTIVIADSYTGVHASCTAAAYAAHGLKDEAKLEIANFGTVSRLNTRSIDWILNSNANCVIITHRGNKRGIMEKGTDKWYPILGSQNLSGNLPHLVNALWYMPSWSSVTMSKPLDGAVEAFTRGGAERFAGLKPKEAITAYFGTK